ncbi:Fructose-1,6-bisphosphatase, chloroplastic [Galdieria sulphuraria]|nr:Fructose-1,6-bisphosphatase, chloroplastic [Galdieria sulphuraria]
MDDKTLRFSSLDHMKDVQVYFIQVWISIKPTISLQRRVSRNNHCKRYLPYKMIAVQPQPKKTPVAEYLQTSQDTPTSLTRYLLEVAKQNKDMGDMVALINGIQFACKKIASLVGKAGVTDLMGIYQQGIVNVHGEEQKKLDVLSNEVLKNALKYSGKMAVIASEEEDVPIMVEESYSGNYVVVFDPLDGSSNLDAGLPTGTIFGVFQQQFSCLIHDYEESIDNMELACLQNTLQPGRRLIAAGYCIYSSSTMLVLSLGNGLHCFTLDTEVGEFVLTRANIQIPQRGVQDYIERLKKGNNQTNCRYSARYVGSMVADVHRTILYGGIFGYPADKKNVSGKLRLVYECAPMAYLVEQAGDIHERKPLILGSPADIEEFLQVYGMSRVDREDMHMWDNLSSL